MSVRVRLRVEVTQDRDAFWEQMPSNTDGYKGVLFDDELLGARWFGMGPYFAQRIRVELKNDDPSKSEELFHNKEQPNTVKPKLSEEALALWIRTAKARKLPAIYTTQSRIFVLPAGYYAEAEADPRKKTRSLAAANTRARRCSAQDVTNSPFRRSICLGLAFGSTAICHTI